MVAGKGKRTKAAVTSKKEVKVNSTKMDRKFATSDINHRKEKLNYF